MKKTYQAGIVMITLLFSSLGNAGGYVTPGTIRSMQSAYNGWLIVMNGANANPDGCGKSQVFLAGDHPQYDELYSMLLAAYSAGREVNIAVNGCFSVVDYKLFNFIYTSWGIN